MTCWEGTSEMARKKFDVVIGNPPYQEEAQGDGTRDTPIYHLFMDAAYEVGEKVMLVTPARFLFNAGFTPRAWNEKMLADPHLSVPIYVANSADLFPGTDIKGGIAITYRDSEHVGEPIGTFAKHAKLATIVEKVSASGSRSIEAEITSSRSYAYTVALYSDHPDLRQLRPDGNEGLISTNTFAQFDRVLHGARPEDGAEYSQILGVNGRNRELRWVKRTYLTGPPALEQFKVVVPESNGSGGIGDVLSTPLVVGPHVAVTQTFITIGAFDAEAEASACLKYVKSKFARTMLSVLKVTQHNPANTWKHVPNQDFTSASDIDWSKSIPEIDRQLYAKYGLSPEEIAFIESHVKPMT